MTVGTELAHTTGWGRDECIHPGLKTPGSGNDSPSGTEHEAWSLVPSVVASERLSLVSFPLGVST